MKIVITAEIPHTHPDGTYKIYYCPNVCVCINCKQVIPEFPERPNPVICPITHKYHDIKWFCYYNLPAGFEHLKEQVILKETEKEFKQTAFF